MSRLSSEGASSDPEDESPSPVSISSLFPVNSLSKRSLMTYVSSENFFEGNLIDPSTTSSWGIFMFIGTAMFSYMSKVQHKSHPTHSSCSQVKWFPAFGPMSLPQKELSIVKMFANLSSLNVATQAVASFDF